MADDGTYLRTETVPIHRSWGTHRDGKVEARSPVHRAWASSRDGPVTSTASWKQTARWSMQTTSPKKRTGGRSSSPTKKTAGVRSEGRLRVGLGGSLGSSSKHNHLSGSNAMAEQENLAVTTGKRLLHASDYDGPSTFTAGPKLSVGVSPRRAQLKIGSSATKKLMKTKRTKEILASTKGANDDEARVQKRTVKDTYNAWVDGKKAIERTARSEQAAVDRERSNIDFAGYQNRADDAFEKWKATKKEQAKSKKLKGGGSKSGPITVSEFICGWRRLNLGPLDLLLNYQTLLLALDTNGKIDPDKFTVMMTQVEIQLKTDLAIKQLDAANHGRPPPGTKKTQAEIERDRLEKVQIRIGQQILKTIAPNRQAFGQSIKSIESIFIAMDEDGNGRLERHEFREGLKRLDLGINSTQFVELLKGFDADGSGDIDYAEFENFLIRCKAIQDADNPRVPNMKFDLAWGIAETMHFEMNEIGSRFTAALQNAFDTRKHRGGKSPAGAGAISTAELKARLTMDDSPHSKFGGLPLTQRKDVLKAFSDVHRIVDSRASRKTGLVSLDEIDLFMLMVEQRLNDKMVESEMDPREKKRNDSRYKICKTMLKNGSLQNVSFHQIMKTMNKTNRPFMMVSEETGGRVIHAEHFKLSVSSLNIGLSIVQTDDLIQAFDSEGTQVIDMDHFVHFFYYAKERMEREAEWKKDPRSRVCDDMLRLITPNEAIMPMFKQLHFQLMHDQIHKLRPARRTSQTALADSMASYNSDRRASVAGMSSAFGENDQQNQGQGGGRTVGYDEDFDATWAPPGQEIVMPPGSKPAGAHWTTGKLDRGEDEEPQEVPRGTKSRRGSTSSSGGGRRGSVGSRRGSVGTR